MERASASRTPHVSKSVCAQNWSAVQRKSPEDNENWSIIRVWEEDLLVSLWEYSCWISWICPWVKGFTLFIVMWLSSSWRIITPCWQADEPHCPFLHEAPSSITLLKGSANMLLLPKSTVTHSHIYSSNTFKVVASNYFLQGKKSFLTSTLGCNIISPLGMEAWQVFQDACPEERRKWGHFSDVGWELSWDLGDRLICRCKAKAGFCEPFNTCFSGINTSYTT